MTQNPITPLVGMVVKYNFTQPCLKIYTKECWLTQSDIDKMARNNWSLEKFIEVEAKEDASYFGEQFTTDDGMHTFEVASVNLKDVDDLKIAINN